MDVPQYQILDISIHALLAESDRGISVTIREPHQFLSTLSLRRATPMDVPQYQILDISIHALLAESDEFRKLLYPGSTNFYPRSPCGERPRAANCQQRNHHISIHALLAESDGGFHKINCQLMVFLSTLSLRRATINHGQQGPAKSNFYPRSPCGERLLLQGFVKQIFHFYPRSPCGERLCRQSAILRTPLISIHALLAESDAGHTTIVVDLNDISIHALLAESDCSASRYLSIPS